MEAPSASKGEFILDIQDYPQNHQYSKPPNWNNFKFTQIYPQSMTLPQSNSVELTSQKTRVSSA